MIALVLSLLHAVPADPFELVTTLKPVGIEAADTPLIKLRKEYYNARLIAIQKTQAESPWIGLADDRRPKWRRLFDQIGPLAEAGAALEPTPAGRAKWYELRVAGAREAERAAEDAIHAGREWPQTFHLMLAARLDAQIDLLTDFPDTDSPQLHLKDIYARPHPRAKADAPQPTLPKLVESAIKPDAKDTPLWKLQKARVREQALYVAMTNEVIATGGWQTRDFRDSSATQTRLGADLAELVDKPEDRIKAFELRLDAMKHLEKFGNGMVAAGRFRPQEAEVARAARLDAEIELLRLRAAHKLATNEQPDVKYADPKLLALWKLPPFVLDAIKPDENDTPLLKLQKARAGDRLVANEKHKEVVAIGVWDAEVFADAVTYPAALAESLAELVETPADRIKCYEMRLERMKELEKVVAEKVENGHSWPNDIYFAKVARVEAEIALLKVKDAGK